jgi:hypothetical protein
LIPATALGSGRHPECPVRFVPSIERPWYPDLKAITSLRPVCTQASMTAVSTASVPLFVKKERVSLPGASSATIEATSICFLVT